MELLALNSAHHRFNTGWSLGLGIGAAKPYVIGRESRFHLEDWGDSGEVELPDHCICGNQSESYGSAVCLPQCHPVSCSVTAPGNTPIAPCGTASFCFPGALHNKFENSGKNAAQTSSGLRPRKHSLALGSMGPLRLVVTRAIREFKYGDSPCI
jgi:hypothetical protein